MVPGGLMRYVMIANPTAGRRDTARYAQRVHRLLKQGGADCTLEFTTQRGGAESLARRTLQQHQAKHRADSRLCIVACGGDGTVQEVVNAIAHETRPSEPVAVSEQPPRPILGLAPAGRCNDFASALGIGRDAQQVARVLLAGHARAVDLGRVDGRYFCTVAALGFDAAVSRYVNDMRLPLRGTIAYLYGALRVLVSYRPAQVRIASNDAAFEGPLFLTASANTPSYGGQMRIAPQASPLDGLLDVCMVSALSRWRVLRLIRHVIKGRHVGLPEVRMMRTPSLRIESAMRQEIWADGEHIGQTPATIEVVPHAIEVLLPLAGHGRA